MFRFSIRELMLVTLVVAMAAGWFTDRLMVNSEVSGLKAKLKPLEEEHRMAEAAKAAMQRDLTQQLQDLSDRMREMGGDHTAREHPSIPGLYLPDNVDKPQRPNHAPSP